MNVKAVRLPVVPVRVIPDYIISSGDTNSFEAAIDIKTVENSFPRKAMNDWLRPCILESWVFVLLFSLI